MTTERIKALFVLILSFVLIVIGFLLIYTKFLSHTNKSNQNTSLISTISILNDYDDEDKVDSAVFYKEAVIAHKKNELKMAVILLEKQIQSTPEHAQSYYLLARIYEDNILPGHQGKMLTEMKNKYLKYNDIKPNGVRSRLVKLKLAKNYLRFALISNNQDELDQAQKLLLGMNQNDSDVKMSLGTYYLAKNNNDKAVVEFKKAVNVQNDDAVIKYNSLGLAYLKLGKFSDAANVLEKAISLQPENDYAHNNLGVAYLRSSRFINAKKSFEKAVKINPKNKKARENLNWVSTNKEFLKMMRLEQENDRAMRNM